MKQLKFIIYLTILIGLFISNNAYATTFEWIGDNYRFARNDNNEVFAFYSVADGMTVVGDRVTVDMYAYLQGTGGVTETIVEYVNELSPRGNLRQITKDFYLNGYTFNFTVPLNTYYLKAINDTYFKDYRVKSETNIYIDQFIQQIVDKERESYSFDGVKAILEMRKYIAYTPDTNKMLGLDYFATPVETLVEGSEDCDGMSILIGTLLERYTELGGRYNLDVIFIEFKTHLALAIEGYVTYGTYYTFNGIDYFALETTSNTSKIGEWFSTKYNNAKLVDLITYYK